jgi:hypothetical protein
MTYTKTKIYSDTEYLAQGFTKEELPKIKRFDTISNYLFGDLNEVQRYHPDNALLMAEYEVLMKELGI